MQFVNADSNHYKFTGKERDAETQLDYFGARYSSNVLGRWISADWSAAPIPVPYADFSGLQSLNLNGYVRGLPTTRIDADGHDGWDLAKGFLKGTANFVVGTVKAALIASIPVYGLMKLGTSAGGSVLTAGHNYATKGASGMMNAVLDQGPKGAMEVVTEAVLTGGLAASGRVNSVLPESAATRLPQDVSVNPRPPAANNGNGTVGPSATQNAAAQTDVASARAAGHTDIRMNQQQVGLCIRLLCG